MDDTLFIEQLRDSSLEDGRVHIQLHANELADHATFGVLLSDEALRVLYSPFVSLKLAELLIFYGEYVQHSSSHALGLKAKGDVLRYIGHHQAAMESLDEAGEEFLRLGDECNWARSRISWILACAWLGHVEEALQGAARARDVFLSYSEYYWVCIIDHNTAVIYRQIGRYQDAFKLYEKMLAIYPTLTGQSETFIKRSIAMAEVNQAINLAWLGKFEEAYRLQQKAQASFVVLGETSHIINSEINLADFDYTQGYYGSALRRYYQARDIAIQNNVNDPLLLAELKLWMANCLVKLNRAQEACQLAYEAVGVCRELGSSLQASNALREYATSLIASDRVQEALVALDEVWVLFTRVGFDYQAAITKLQQAELLLEMGLADEAYSQAQLIREYFDAQNLAASSVRASLVMVGALIESVQQAKVSKEKAQKVIFLREAMVLGKQAAMKARQSNLQEEVYKSHYLLGRIFVLQEDLTKASRHYGAAIAQIERILDDLMYDLSPSFLNTTWAVYEDMIAICLQQSQKERAFSYLEQARSIALRQYLNKSSVSQVKREEDVTSPSVLQANSAALLRIQRELKDWQERYHDYNVLLADIDTSVSPAVDQELIRHELKQCEVKISELFERLHLHQSNTFHTPHSKKRETRKEKSVDIAQLRRQLSPDQLLLAYFLYKGRLVIFAITTEHLATYENPDGVAQLERLLPLLHAHLQPAGWPDIQRPPQKVIRRLLNKLHNLLIDPVAEMLPSPSGYLTIVPYGPLHKLPFHALYNGSHFLIEDFRINYLPTSSFITRLGTREGEQSIRSVDIELSSTPPLVLGYSGKGHLQRVLDEAKKVASLLDGHCYLEEEATIARLIEQASDSPIIHLATHGQSRLDAPNFSYVLLSDGQLNAIDAFNLNLNGCELVTLSGCETGLSLISGGDEQLGLGRAFLAAGADSLVMSLWQVEDNATNELMQLFYKYLLQGESKVQALRAAQCWLLRQEPSIYNHPYFWASFRLVGGTGPLNFQKAARSIFAPQN